MTHLPGAAELMRALGLDVDGPVRWGAPASSRSAGIFAVETPEPRGRAPIDLVAVRAWRDRVPTLTLDGERPTESALADRLASFWVPDHPLLYVGRSAKALGPRVAALYATELGHARPHPGGHWLRTLRDHAKLRIWWAETDAPEEYEDALIGAFAASVPDATREALAASGGVLPWANLEAPSGETKRTGLAGSLLRAEDTPAPRSGVRRSERGPRTVRPSPPGGSASRRPARRPAAPKAGPPEAGRDRPTHVTAAGLEALRAELAELTGVERPAVIERVKQARELGDLRENADYEAARNEQSFLEGRILALEEKLRTAVVIEAASSGAVSLGSTVHVELDGEASVLTIVGSTESDPAAGRISQASPVGRALLGHRAGDTVVVRTPAAEMAYRIVEVR